jgi:hypothetical protein
MGWQQAIKAAARLMIDEDDIKHNWDHWCQWMADNYNKERTQMELEKLLQIKSNRDYCTGADWRAVLFINLRDRKAWVDHIHSSDNAFSQNEHTGITLRFSLPKDADAEEVASLVESFAPNLFDSYQAEDKEAILTFEHELQYRLDSVGQLWDEDEDEF